MISNHGHQDSACGKRNEGSLPIHDPQTSGSYGVTLKDPIHPRDFNPICIPCNVSELEQDFKLGCWKHVLALQLCHFYLQLKDPGKQRKKSELSSAVMLMSVKKKVFKVYMYIQGMIMPKCLFLLILKK